MDDEEVYEADPAVGGNPVDERDKPLPSNEETDGLDWEYGEFPE